MPSRLKRKKAPAAPKGKRILHALYLAQPFLQFAALMAIMLVLSRCSPLAPSTERGLNQLSSNATTPSQTENGNSQAEEKDIEELLRSSKVDSAETLLVTSETKFKDEDKKGLNADRPGDKGRVEEILRKRRSGSKGRLLAIQLLREQKEDLFNGKTVRIALADRLKNMLDSDSRKSLFKNLDNLDRGASLSGKSILVLPDVAMQDEQSYALPVSLGFALAVLPSGEKAFLEIRNLQAETTEEQKELIKSNLRDSLFLAVVLE
ncbi:MAG TPA: hypothetical protein VIH99_10275 [Bdellovibrionota bacterium]|jgi:hypothetical protein